MTAEQILSRKKFEAKNTKRVAEVSEALHLKYRSHFKDSEKNCTFFFVEFLRLLGFLVCVAIATIFLVASVWCFLGLSWLGIASVSGSLRLLWLSLWWLALVASFLDL